MQPSDPLPTATVVSAAAARLSRCRRLLVLAGAGLSADAGVPTFRGEGGLWRTHKAEELASNQGFAKHPEAVWEWYHERRLHVARCEPHPGQRTLALLQKHLPSPAQVLIATTNEDDLLERAGVHPVLHLHGSLFETACAVSCGWRARDDHDNSLSLVPCPRCGAAVRPGSVWFGEPLSRGVLEAVHQFNPDGCLLVGSSMLVQPAAAIPVEIGLAGAPVIEINPEETPFSRTATVSLRGSAKELLPRLVDVLTSDTVREQWRKLT